MILIGGQIESISTRKDKSLKITIGSQELTPNQSTDIFLLNQSFCYIGFKQEQFKKDEADLLDSLKSDFEYQKTPSQRLRAVLYLNYEQDNKGYKDFGTFYASEMERIIEHYKTKLE